jgi:hypothetical protein
MEEYAVEAIKLEASAGMSLPGEGRVGSRSSCQTL